MKTKLILVSLILLILNIIGEVQADNINNAEDVNKALQGIDIYRDQHGNSATTGNSAANLIVNLSTNTISVTCDNGVGTNTLTLSAGEIQNIINQSINSGYDVVITPPPPPPPPPPVHTSSSSTHGGCGSYISSWSTTWSNCVVQGAWNSNGTIKCLQTPSFSPNVSSCGSQVCTTSYTDGVATGTSCGPCTGCPGNVPQPNTPADTKIINMNLNNPSSTCNGTYANNNDTCRVGITISGITNQNRPVVGWGTEGNLSNITDISNESSDRINGGGIALNFSDITNTGPINGKGNYYINGIKSRAPFLSNVGKIGLKAGDTYLTLKNISYSFNKPLTGKLQASGDNGISWNILPTLGTLLKYKLSYSNLGNVIFDINSYSIENFINKIKPISSDLQLQNKSLSGTDLNTNGSIFSARINTNSGLITTLPVPGLQLESPIISYNLGGQDIKYSLSKDVLPNDATPIKITGEEFLGLKVIGTLQGDGKQTITGQSSNFSDIYSFTLKTSMRKDAYSYIKNMKSGDILDGVKYIEGEDISISGNNLDYETLVIKNGNVIIDGNLNTSGNKLGIMVLKDSYDTNYDYINSGNIYINNNVTYINALFYADGGIISSQNGNPYTEDSTSRTYDLNNQLTIKGSIFTRNTIGGAVLSGGYYIMPGGSKTNDFDKAMIYDLNYLRRGNNGCDKDGNSVCTNNGEYREPVVIIYNSGLSINAPKIFNY